MKKILLSVLVGLCIPASLYAYTSPGKPTGHVNDFAAALSPEDHVAIESRLVALERQTGIQVAVVTVSSLGGDSVEQYALKLFEEWGIGNKEKDTGILMLVSTGDRVVKIETGYGSGDLLTDVESADIIRLYLIPSFKEGQYSTGILRGVTALAATIEGRGTFSDPSSVASTRDVGGLGGYDQRTVIISIALLVIIGRILARIGSWRVGGGVGLVIGIIIGFVWGFLYTGIISIIGLTIFGIMFGFFGSRLPPGSGSMFLGGFGSGWGSGSGGFGGFGGGSSGGGGASGRW